MKQVSAACERNKDPILAVLRRAFSESAHVLEIGSGTGQHAVFFALNLPHLIWQTSDLPPYHESIQAYIEESGALNLRAPIVLDTGRRDAADQLRAGLERRSAPVQAKRWSITAWFRKRLPRDRASAPPIDAVFTANTIQIMSEADIVGMFRLLENILPVSGRFCLYSPLQYSGRHTSPGNADFDASLKARDPRMGVRDFELLDGLAREAGLLLVQDHAMPANNRLLEYRRA
jgi:hypothetical protein